MTAYRITPPEWGPDPAAHLWPLEGELWAEYRGRLDADPAARDAWRKINTEIIRLRAEAGWPQRGTAK